MNSDVYFVNNDVCFVSNVAYVLNSYVCFVFDQHQANRYHFVFASILAGGAGDPCLNNACMNGATCLPNGEDYLCKCPNGYTGKYCQG